jgi:NosR/NirI family nitrous oxide reductase transcriptional regulator
MKKIVASFILFLTLLLVSNSLSGSFDFFAQRYDYKPNDVLDATRFVKKGGYWEGYNEDRLIGFVIMSDKWTKKLVGYSGKHMETLIGIDTKGIITGVKVLFHSEPIVLIGLKEKNYQKFMGQYIGKNINESLTVGNGISIDAVSGATVTAVVQNAIILRSAKKAAEKAGIFKFAKGTQRKIKQEFSRLSWKELLTSGAVRNITVTAKELGQEGENDYLDLYFGLLTVPSIGGNVVGEDFYKSTMASLERNDLALFIFARGEGSFKGSGFARGGVFDRFNLEQDDRVYIFRDRDYQILNDIKAEGAPEIKEGGLFIIKGNEFDQGSPFKFNLILPYRVNVKKEFKSYRVDYQIPDRFLE